MEKIKVYKTDGQGLGWGGVPSFNQDPQYRMAVVNHPQPFKDQLSHLISRWIGLRLLLYSLFLTTRQSKNFFVSTMETQSSGENSNLVITQKEN